MTHRALEGQHVVFLGLLPPDVDQLLELVRVFGGKIVALGRIVLEVKQLPRLLKLIEISLD